MALTSRADWRAHMAMMARDLHVKRIRGHGLFDDDMAVFKQPGQYSWYNIYRLVDFCLSIGITPVLELSFVPEWLASTNHTVTHYKGYASPPNNMTAWFELNRNLGLALVNRYGPQAKELRLEVWNEPNDNFFDGTQAQYWDLYAHAAWGLKNASLDLKVGGPATNSPTTWLADFLNFTTTSGVPFDFISSHNYAGCGTDTGNADKVVNGIAEARAIIGNDVEFLMTEYGAACTQGIGLSDDRPGSRYHDGVAQAAFVVAVVSKTSMLPVRPPDILSYWAGSDVFDEQFFPVANCSAHGGFGLVALGCGGNPSVEGIPKPTYRAYQMMASGGDTLLNVTRQDAAPAAPSLNCSSRRGYDLLKAHVIGNINAADESDCCSACSLMPACAFWSFATDETHSCWLKSNDEGGYTPNPDRISGPAAPLPPTVRCAESSGVLATLNATDGIHLIFFNQAPEADTTIIACNVTAELVGAVGAPAKARLRRIDSTHANYEGAFEAMGRPDYTTPAQDEELLKASTLLDELVAVEASGDGHPSVTLLMQPNTVAEVLIPVSS